MLLAVRKTKGKEPPSTKHLSPLAVVEAHLGALTEQLYEVEDIVADLEDMEAQLEGMLTNPVVLTNVCLVRDRRESAGRFISKDWLGGGKVMAGNGQSRMAFVDSAADLPATEPVVHAGSKSSFSAFVSPFVNQTDDSVSKTPLQKAVTRVDLMAKTFRRNALGKSSPREIHEMEPAARHTTLAAAMQAADAPRTPSKHQGRAAGLKASSKSIRGMMQGLMGEADEEVVEVIQDRRRPVSVLGAVASPHGEAPQMRNVHDITTAGIPPSANAIQLTDFSYTESKGTSLSPLGGVSFHQSANSSAASYSLFGNGEGDADDPGADPGSDQRLKPRRPRRKSRVRPNMHNEDISTNSVSVVEKSHPSVTGSRSSGDLLRNAHSTTFKREHRPTLLNDAIIAQRQREVQQVRSILHAPATAPSPTNGGGEGPSSSTRETNILIVDHGSADVPVEILTDDGPSLETMAIGVDDVVQIKDETMQDVMGMDTVEGSSHDSLPGEAELEEPLFSGGRRWTTSHHHDAESGNTAVLVDHDAADVPVETLLEPDPSSKTIPSPSRRTNRSSWNYGSAEPFGQGVMGDDAVSSEDSLDSLPGQPDQGQRPMIAGTHVTSYVVYDDGGDS